MVQNEQGTLLVLQTLLALERNFLAEERTCLAEFRTGLTLTVLGPTIGTVLAYIFSSLALQEALLYDLINLIVFSIITILGLRMTLRSRSKLKEIRKMKSTLKTRQSKIVQNSTMINDLLGDCLCLDFLKTNDL
jgi:uncharacterized membrane protein YidH (DUF202 family)